MFTSVPDLKELTIQSPCPTCIHTHTRANLAGANEPTSTFSECVRKSDLQETNTSTGKTLKLAESVLVGIQTENPSLAKQEC